ncbi:MAG: hypothetical protein DI585_05480 [Pseudomonas fluorescens]|nr:MAG: hypothetical protein DI585_05480 [Pseudomonas fluorescens]
MTRAAILCILLLTCLATAVLIYTLTSEFQRHNLRKRFGSFKATLITKNTELPHWLNLALQPNPPAPQAGAFQWQPHHTGFETTELPLLVNGEEVERLYLARINPSHFQFQVLTNTSGTTDLNSWMTTHKPLMVINASFFGKNGTPTTPILSNGQYHGPTAYKGDHGAFVANATTAQLVDLETTSWNEAFGAATNAVVSYPLLLSENGSHRAIPTKFSLANRSFIAEDASGNILLGTTKNAFFTLERLAKFLKTSPLDLKLALNLDGGPAACQAIQTENFSRNVCGEWEVSVYLNRFKVLKTGRNTNRWPLPTVLAIFPNSQ